MKITLIQDGSLELENISLVNKDWTVSEWKSRILVKFPNTENKELHFWHASNTTFIVCLFFSLLTCSFFTEQTWLDENEKVSTYFDALTEIPNVQLKDNNGNKHENPHNSFFNIWIECKKKILHER